jgi:ferredoxin
MTEVKEKKVEEIKKEADEAIKCPVNKALYYTTEFLSGPMCGKCFPCAMGTYEARVRLKNIVEAQGTEEDLLVIKRIAEDMLEASMCKKGKDTAKFILEWIATDVYKEHLEGRCPDMECQAFTEYRIIPEKCIMCGLCKEACVYNAIIGEKAKPFMSGYAPFEIRQKRCAKCGDCLPVCPKEAIVVVNIKDKEKVKGKER